MNVTVIHQSYRKLLLILPLACLMFLVSAVILWISWVSVNPIGIVVGTVAVGFFFPALVMLLQAVIFPSYLTIDDGGITCRFYSIELSIAWDNIKEITGGMGWPSFIFHDPEIVASRARFSAFAPIGWLLSIPTKFVSLLLNKPMPNMYPATRKALLRAFRSTEQSFGFHYGLPSDLLEKGNQEILALLRRRARHGTRHVK
jgi:hypothetical protein